MIYKFFKMFYNGNGYAPLGMGVLGLYFVSPKRAWFYLHPPKLFSFCHRDFVEAGERRRSGRWESKLFHSASRQNGQG